MVTDEYGYNAVTTSPSSDFVQSDEGWWQTAWTVGATTAQATADPATQRTVVELAGVIREDGTPGRCGESQVRAIEGRFRARTGKHVRTRACASTWSIPRGKILASSAAAVRFKPFAAFSHRRRPRVRERRSPSTAIRLVQRGAVGLTNNGRWRVIAHMNDVDAGRAYKVARAALVGGVGVMMLADHGSV